MRQYRCTKIVGDKYGAQWTVEAFVGWGAIRAVCEIYMNTLPIFTSGTFFISGSVAAAFALFTATENSVNVLRSPSDNAKKVAAASGIKDVLVECAWGDSLGVEFKGDSLPGPPNPKKFQQKKRISLGGIGFSTTRSSNWTSSPFGTRQWVPAKAYGLAG
jgi:hypothetical protein